MPWKSLKKKLKLSSAPTIVNSAAECPRIILGDLGDYSPTHFLCCHSYVVGRKRPLTKVWMCAFEPSIENPGETGCILATCGGNTVCFIDVHSGLVMMRFKDTDDVEDFYTLTWTTLEKHGKKVNVLAVAGRAECIKLICPEQLVCYRTIRAHHNDVNCLLIHPRYPSLLFRGARTVPYVQFVYNFTHGHDKQITNGDNVINGREFAGDNVDSADVNIEHGSAGILTIAKLDVSKNKSFLFWIHSMLDGELPHVTHHGAVILDCVGGSEDRSIKLWNLELPGEKEPAAYSPLLRLTLSAIQGKPLAMAIVGSMLVVGTENGCFCWDLGPSDSLMDMEKAVSAGKRWITIIIFPSHVPVDTVVTVDEFHVATRCVAAGEIVVWDVLKHITSLVNPKLEVILDPRLRLQFPKTNTKYMRMSCSQGVLTAGDDGGNIYLYNLNVALKIKSSTSCLLQPSAVVQWPEVEYPNDEENVGVAINHVTISSDHRVLAAGTDDNIVCVWTRP